MAFDDDDDTQDQSDDSQDDGTQAVAAASPDEVDAHRNMIGDTLNTLSQQGIDVDSIAEELGLSTTDVNEMSHADLASVTQYLGSNQPELLQDAASRFPQAQGLLSALTGGGGGIGGLLGRLL